MSGDVTNTFSFTTSNISFYADGSVESGTLASVTAAITMPASGGTDYTFTASTISFYDDGSVKSGTLAKNAYITVSSTSGLSTNRSRSDCFY